MHTKGEQGSSASQRMASFMLMTSSRPATRPWFTPFYASHCIHHIYFSINTKNCGTCGLRTWILLCSQRRQHRSTVLQRARGDGLTLAARIQCGCSPLSGFRRGSRATACTGIGGEMPARRRPQDEPHGRNNHHTCVLYEGGSASQRAVRVSHGGPECTVLSLSHKSGLALSKGQVYV